MGKEKLNHNKQWAFYKCDCGKDTEYGIIRNVNNKEYDIESCCGGCVSASNIKYCPYCGNKIEITNKKEEDEQ